MIEVAIMLFLFLGMGITVRKFNVWTALLLCVLIAGVVTLLYLT